MKLSIIFCLIFLFVLSSLYLGKAKSEEKEMSDSESMLTNKDKPINFGYKNIWIAVKTDNKQRIAEILGIGEIKLSNWEHGLKATYNDDCFITPRIGYWTLVVGINVIDAAGTLDGVIELEKKLNKLSTEFGEAQSFGTYRVDEYHHWIKSINGKTARVYAYSGASGETFKNFGKLTPPEQGLNLFNSLSKEAESDKYWEREDLDYADEDLVMKIAGNWSINPSKLTERTDIADELGIVGKVLNSSVLPTATKDK